jgi:nickel transport protein
VRSLRLASLGAVLALVPLAASAHEVLHSVERGKAVAVKAYFADGEVLAYTRYEIYSPADPKIPMQKGRTDRNGYLAFVPDTAGKWRVKIVDDTGHGLDTQVDVGAGEGGPGREQASSTLSTAAFVLRPIVGVAVIAAVFAALVLLRRRKGTAQ